MHWKFLCIFHYQPFKKQNNRVISDKHINIIKFMFITNIEENLGLLRYLAQSVILSFSRGSNLKKVLEKT